MLDVLTWWFLVELLGLAVWPVAFRFFRQLPERGYAFTKMLGLLVVGYLFWLLTTLGFLENSRGAIALVGMVVAGISWGLVGTRRSGGAGEQGSRGEKGRGREGAGERGSGEADDTRHPSLDSPPVTRHPSPDLSQSPLQWLKENRSIVITLEVVFAVALVAWAAFRAYNPEITATEKPMEYAFLNGILKSAQFPPRDPWMSGYAISYYYFGYVLIAMLTMLSGVAPSVAFNLAIALLFALSAVGVFGVVFDLVEGRQGDKETGRQVDREIDEQGRKELKGTRRGAYIFATLGVLFLLIVGNLEGFFEATHAAGVGSDAFYQALDINNLADAPTTGAFAPSDNWWWWRASRVVNDRDPKTGNHVEVIDEFPFFSFLLGDMHPHVLALPFAFLALAVGLEVLRRGREIRDSRFEIRDWQSAIRNPQSAISLLLMGVIVGAFGFMNAWDLPTYAVIIVAAFALAQYRAAGAWTRKVTRDVVIFAVGLAVLSIVLYAPFYIGFQSQARGIVPQVFFKTRLQQYLVMFGLSIFILLAFLITLTTRARERLTAFLTESATYAIGIAAIPALIALGAVAMLSVRADLRETLGGVLGLDPSTVVGQLARAYFGTLLGNPWVPVLLLLMIAAGATLLRQRVGADDASVVFALLLGGVALVLTFGTEFIYLRDVFETRMNTVFKFYFQAWVLFAVASAFALAYLWRALPGIARGIVFGGFALLFLMSMVYPILAAQNKTDNFKGPPTLDGTQWIKNFNPEDYAVIEWLNANAPRDTTILEATGGEYTYYARISMATGLPTVLGWGGHESQWGRTAEQFGSREGDIEKIYRTQNADEALTLIDKYGISYVVVGGLEKEKYHLSPAMIGKFDKMMRVAFQKGETRIYQR